MYDCMCNIHFLSSQRLILTVKTVKIVWIEIWVWIENIISKTFIYLWMRNFFFLIIEKLGPVPCSPQVFWRANPALPSDLPFEFKRLQFPIRLAFAMTINKSQGQSLKVAGINLERPCFSHGQLYVACSRVDTPKNLFIFATQGKTKNVVYKRALQWKNIQIGWRDWRFVGEDYQKNCQFFYKNELKYRFSYYI